MSTPQEQAQKQMRQQAIQQRMTSALKGGLDFLQDEAVVAPIKHADGIVDLKWMLRTIASGEFGIDTDPGRKQREAAAKADTPPPPPAGEGEEGDSKSNNGKEAH